MAKTKELITSCDWINKAIEDKIQMDNTYIKLITIIQEEEIGKIGGAASIFGVSEKTQNIIRRIERIASEEKGKMSLLEMTKREIGCE